MEFHVQMHSNMDKSEGLMGKNVVHKALVNPSTGDTWDIPEYAIFCCDITEVLILILMTPILCSWQSINSCSNNKILNCTKLETIADDIIIVTIIVIFVFYM